MAYSVNKVILLGNLGKDPELRYTQSNKAVARFSVATSGGTREQERTDWHNVVAWDKLAELCGRLIGKGSKVYVEGRLQTREYNDRDGNRRWSTEVVAREIVFLTTVEGRGGGGGGGGGGGRDSWERSGGGGGGGRPTGGGGGAPSGGGGPSGGGAPSGGGGGDDGGGWDRGAQKGQAPRDDIPYSDDEDIPF